ncbi:MAG: PTS lactose/cellobiose transporter subunit IIA [Bacilli bacterium]
MGLIKKSELNNVSMEIILYAGDARSYISEALAEAKIGNFKEAAKLIKKTDAKIVKAHKAQTDIIQSATSGKDIEYSLLFAHAQDTLMTIISEVKLSKEFIEI